MPGNADPSRIYHDPALTDRRGDATGGVALLFVFLLVVGFAVVAVGLISLPALVADPTPGPATPAPIATARPTPTSAPPASPAPGESGLPQPSAGTEPSGGPGASSGPLPTRRPLPTDAGRPASEGVLGEMVPVFLKGKRTGGVQVRSFKVGDLAGVTLPPGAKVMILLVRYSTANGMAYDAADWVIVDSDGKRHASLGDRAPSPALGSGTIAAGSSITANVAFIRDPGISIDRIVLTDGKGHDLVSVGRNSSIASPAP